MCVAHHVVFAFTLNVLKKNIMKSVESMLNELKSVSDLMNFSTKYQNLDVSILHTNLCVHMKNYHSDFNTHFSNGTLCRL